MLQVWSPVGVAERHGTSVAGLGCIKQLMILLAWVAPCNWTAGGRRPPAGQPHDHASRTPEPAHDLAQPPPRGLAAAGADHRLRRRGAGQPRPVHRQRRAARHRAGPPRRRSLATSPGCSTATRSSTRRCWCCSAGWPRAAAGTTASCSGWRCSRPRRRPAARPPSLGMLVAFRVLQAAGAALLTPTSLGLVLATTAPERRHGAVRAWTAVGGLAAALGPVVGGLLVAPAGAGCSWSTCRSAWSPLFVGWRRLPAVPGPPGPAARRAGRGADHRRRGRADARAGQGQRLGLGLGRAPWPCWRALGGVLVAVRAALARAPQPADRRPAVPGAHVQRRLGGRAVFSIAFGAMLLSRCCGAQEVWGWSALRTGLAVAPGPLMVPLFSFLVAGRLIARFGPGRVIGVGAAVFAAGVAWWALAAGSRPITSARCSAGCCSPASASG